MKQLYVMTLGLLSLMIVVVPATAQPQYPNGYGQQQNWRGALAPDDQQKFDQEFAKWVDSQRKNDRDDIAESARHMQDIMNRNNIPSNVPFDQIASNAAPGNGAPYANAGDPNAPYPAYSQTRLSSDDQRKFDEDYAKWVESQRKNDKDDIVKAADKMHEIMARAGIPSNVPFAAIATNGYLAGPSAPAYGYAQASAQRLSSKDQDEFDKSFKHWVDARHKKDMDDVDKNARRMQEIMARYNIPADVPFDRIATEGSAYH